MSSTNPFLTVLSSAFTNIYALGEDACPPIAKIINLMLKLWIKNVGICF